MPLKYQNPALKLLQFQELRKDGGKDRLEIQSVMGTGPGGEGGFGLVGHIVRLWEVG